MEHLGRTRFCPLLCALGAQSVASSLGLPKTKLDPARQGEGGRPTLTPKVLSVSPVSASVLFTSGYRIRGACSEEPVAESGSSPRAFARAADRARLRQAGRRNRRRFKTGSGS